LVSGTNNYKRLRTKRVGPLRWSQSEITTTSQGADN